MARWLGCPLGGRTQVLAVDVGDSVDDMDLIHEARVTQQFESGVSGRFSRAQVVGHCWDCWTLYPHLTPSSPGQCPQPASGSSREDAPWSERDTAPHICWAHDSGSAGHGARPNAWQ